MLESLHKFQDRRWSERGERPLNWDGGYCYPVSDMRDLSD